MMKLFYRPPPASSSWRDLATASPKSGVLRELELCSCGAKAHEARSSDSRFQAIQATPILLGE